ncbi:MAG: hypothetical protein AAGA65_20020 [Actinomycetota bacterium]
MGESDFDETAASRQEMVSGETARAGRRLEEALNRARTDAGLGELLQAVEGVYNSQRIDTAYLAEALTAEQRLVADLKRRNQASQEAHAKAVTEATLKEQKADRLHSRILELESALEDASLRAEADRLMALSERDTAVENLSSRIRSLEAENGRLTDELAELRQKVRPIDVATERYADPAVTLLVDGDEMVMRGWAGVPLGIGRARAISSLSRLAETRDAPVEVVFGTEEGLQQEELEKAPIRVRVISNGVPMDTALNTLRDQYEEQTEVAVITDQPDVSGAVGMTRLIEMLGMPTSTGGAAGGDGRVTSIAING